MIAINRLTLQLTKHCNLNCSYCYCHPVTKGKIEAIEINPTLEFLTRAHALGLRHVVLTGGEPLLYPDWNMLIEFLVARKFFIALETNGIALLDNHLEQLKKTKGHIAITLESTCPETHDKIRHGSDAWSRAVSALRRIKQRTSLTTQITFNLTQLTRHEMVEACVLGADLGVSRIKLNPIYRIGPRGIPGAPSLYLEPEDIAELAETYALRIQNKFPFSVRLALPPALYHPNSHLSEAMCTGCDVGAILGVLHDGTIRPCHNFMYSDAHNFGSIYAAYDLEAITHSIRHLPGQDQFDLDGICGDCLMLAKCRGFCRAQAQNEYGTTVAPNRLCQELHEMGRFPEAMRLSNAFGEDRYAGTITRAAKKIRVIPLINAVSPLT